MRRPVLQHTTHLRLGGRGFSVCQFSFKIFLLRISEPQDVRESLLICPRLMEIRAVCTHNIQRTFQLLLSSGLKSTSGATYSVVQVQVRHHRVVLLAIGVKGTPVNRHRRFLYIYDIYIATKQNLLFVRAALIVLPVLLVFGHGLVETCTSKIECKRKNLIVVLLLNSRRLEFL